MAEEQDEINMDDKSVVLEDSDDSDNESEVDLKSSSIIGYVMQRYKKSDDYREQDEQRWLRAYRNYRGLYGPDVQFTEAEKSRVFIKVTKTKTLAAYGQIVDVLFGNSKFPLSVDPTELPDGVVSDVHFDPKAPEELNNEESLESPYGFKGDGKDLPAGATEKSLKDSLGPLSEKLADVDNLKEGVGKTPTAITFSPAMIASKKMLSLQD